MRSQRMKNSLLRDDKLSFSMFMDTESLIKSYYPIVKRIVSKTVIKMPDGLDVDDFVQIGMMGLLKALDKCDYDRSTNEFKAYAVKKIRGAILDKIRSSDRISRYSRDRLKEISKTYGEFMNDGIFDPTDEMVAQRAGLSIKKMNKLLQEVSNSTISSIDRYIYGDTPFIESVADKKAKSPLNMMEESELKNILKDGLLKLNRTELTVLSLYYYEDFTMKEIAGVIDKTESRVSQIRTKSLIKLRWYTQKRLNV